MANAVSGPMLIAHYTDRPTGAEAWLVVDTFVHGVAGGGIRMAPDVTEELVTNLASTMSTKLAIVEPPLGGAKCGIRYNSLAQDAVEVLGRVISAFAPFLRTCWVTGSDLGTDWSRVVAACRTYAGIPHPQYALVRAYSGVNGIAVDQGLRRLEEGTSLAVDNSARLIMSNAVTGWTVCAATLEALAVMGKPIETQRVAIQGFGAVGGSAATFLSKAGAKVVAVSDELGAIVAPRGSALDVAGLLKIRTPPAYKVVERIAVRLKYDYEFVDRDAILHHDADILIPAAGSDIQIDVNRVHAKLIVEGANDPFREETEEALHHRGIIVIPDAIANSGNAGLFGLLVLGTVPIEKHAILDALNTQVRAWTRRVLEHAHAHPRRVFEEHARREIHTRIKEGHSVLPNGLSTEDIERLNSSQLQIRCTMRSPYESFEPATPITTPHNV